MTTGIRVVALCILPLALAACGKFPPSPGAPADTPAIGSREEKVPTIGTFQFAAVPAGRYRVGSVEGGDDEKPRDVEARGFWIGTTEVTEKQYGLGRSRRPVSGLSLAEAQAFCQKLSTMSGRRVRLPTDAEWEIAARGGIVGARFPWGWGKPEDLAAFNEKGSKRVGAYPANGYGLFDMAGNVAEWCMAESGAVVCGGNWADRDAHQLEVFRRVRPAADYRGRDVGFRILLEKE